MTAKTPASQFFSPRYCPWLDRSGRVSLLKVAVLAGVFAPAAWIAWQAWEGELGPKPVMETIHQTGTWAVRLLLISLAVTPLRYVAFANRLILVRRILGVAALAYAAFHLCLYAADQKFVWVTIASEIIRRFYLTIGFIALVGLVVLGVTSTDRMIKRLGAARWDRLHYIVWPIAILALLHFYIQAKLDVTEPVLMTGFFLLLVGVRVMHRLSLRVEPIGLAVLAILAGLATALFETGWYATMTNVPALRVLEANLDFSYSVRPCWWVAATGLGLAALNLGLRLSGKREPARRVRATPAEQVRPVEAA